ncbi:hypothetical protein REMIM1_PE00516 (plasmid) [Rhizobium etli bv. mimosae str. Mim1]|nr:hypothetical protein REMIM1_PE00516 [Rhizobium etli bv. mimosae str. Mim1]
MLRRPAPLWSGAKGTWTLCSSGLSRLPSSPPFFMRFPSALSALTKAPLTPAASIATSELDTEVETNQLGAMSTNTP